MSRDTLQFVIPAQAGIHASVDRNADFGFARVAAFAGMTFNVWQVQSQGRIGAPGESACR